MSIGLLGAGRIAEMHARAPRHTGAHDERLSRTLAYTPRAPLIRSARADLQRATPLSCEQLLPADPGMSPGRAHDTDHRIARSDEIPA